MNTTSELSREEKRSHWANHLKQWGASGISQSDYCRQHQLKPHQFTYWKHVFNDPKKPEPCAENGFVAVQVTRPSVQSTQGMTIQLPNGIHIKSPQPINLELVQEMARWQL
ncbi:MAG TPA: hypothetical protein ENK06_13565 [Gammaproteobacteria bacterium]|nr:hypothetical protein [Gammaproteobacteria bacterium]